MLAELAILMVLNQPEKTAQQERIRQLIAEIRQSGRVVEFATDELRLLDPRKQIAPGKPPILSFRYFLGADRHRFGKLDLMLDDAGH